jgi:hypothetical protein
MTNNQYFNIQFYLTLIFWALCFIAGVLMKGLQ